LAETFGAAAVKGLAELQRALRRVEGNSDKDLKRHLRVIGTTVKTRAAGNLSHRTGRHGEGPTIEGSLRVGVVQRGVSVYTTAPHGYVQDRGGRVGRHHATLLARGSVSQYMTRAVVEGQSTVARELDALMADFGREFES
jgi:hypothetical protein